MNVVVMKFFKLILVYHLILLLQACSSGSFQRYGYDVMKNAVKQRCYQELRTDCDERESYGVYQQKRETVQQQ